MRSKVVRARSRFGPGLTPAVAWIIALHVGLFLVYLFGGEATRQTLLGALAISGESLASGHVWKLFTATLLNTQGLAFFFDVLMLWLFVPVMEQFWGTRRFLTFFVVTSVVANLVSALVGLSLAPAHFVVGLSPFIYASIAAFGVVYAHQPVQFFGVVPIRGRSLAIGMACFVLLFVLLERAWVDGAGFFAAMATAVLMTSGLIQPTVWRLRFQRWRIRRRYQVIDGGALDPRRAAKPADKRWLN